MEKEGVGICNSREEGEMEMVLLEEVIGKVEEVICIRKEVAVMEIEVVGTCKCKEVEVMERVVAGIYRCMEEVVMGILVVDI